MADEVLAALPVPATAAALPRYYGDLPTRWLRERHYDAADADEKTRLWQELNARLLRPDGFLLIELDGKQRLSLLPLGTVTDTFADPLVAAEEFLRRFRSTNAFADLYAKAHRYLTRQQEGALHATEEITRRLRQLETDSSYSQTADIIMANLTQIPVGATEVELYDFYRDQPRLIRLKSGLTPQRVAENLYRKSKNQQLETRLLRERLARHEADALRTMEQLPALEALATGAEFRLLRTWLKEQNLTEAITQTKAEAALPATPFKVFEATASAFWWAATPANNDLLTQRYAHKDDLWLHAKDVTGSHVVIRQRPGQPVPRPVMERAAPAGGVVLAPPERFALPGYVRPKSTCASPGAAARPGGRRTRERCCWWCRPTRLSGSNNANKKALTAKPQRFI